MSRQLAPPLSRPERLRQVRAGLARGLNHRQIAAELGVSRSTVRNILSDPDGAKQRARREKYRGTCLVCGAVTHSDGTSRPSPHCPKHNPGSEKVWTREVVIDAIQRFAAIHGRAPIADEWITGDPVNGYPPRSSVYRSTYKRSSAPFPSWQSALEAAGFPGAHSGRRTYKEVRTMPSNPRYGYVILHENDDGTWEVVSESQETTQGAALNAALNGHQPTGRWVAVPGGHWRPKALRPRTIYDWIEDAVEEPATT